jgi:hypothetical protein
MANVRHGAIPQIALRETTEYPLVSMTLQEIEQEVLGLSERDRAELALVLMRTLSPARRRSPTRRSSGAMRSWTPEGLSPCLMTSSCVAFSESAADEAGVPPSRSARRQ